MLGIYGWNLGYKECRGDSSLTFITDSTSTSITTSKLSLPTILCSIHSKTSICKRAFTEMATTNFGFSTTAEEVADHFKDQIKGKTILITGASPNGIGLAAACAFAPHSPGLLILAGRSPATLSAAAAEIAKLAPTCPTKILTLDLSSLATARVAATEFNSWIDVPSLDILINNAGIMSTPWGKSADGIEQQFATNHIAPFLFTNLIMPKIIAAHGRIVNLSSAGHRFGPVRFNDHNFADGKEYQPEAAYGQSKTANILYAVALAKNESLREKGVTAFSVHPGVIATNIGRHVPFEVLVERKVLKEDGTPNNEGPWKFKTHSQGAATTMVAALDPEIKGQNGAYLADGRIGGEEVQEYAVDKGNARKLWELSEELVGEKFDF
ncbi:putative short-chain dehydrogenase [Clohesyomyces aquaticus]|uniref:Putative short-chain dehydrogenase n=1 Tax=Clohesyomyces aquaticus TaxID=1231657 RepID=A0A1Y1YI03_9PLEO|nr:putative short-chain dehydrogenase [Clohesyomyces aquaticus]